MEPLRDLGRALARLRSLRGLSIAEAAELVEVPPQELEAAERGEVDQDLMCKLAASYAVDATTLRNDGFVEPVAGLEGATVFLLHGAYQDFDAEDLEVLDRAMRAGRLLSSQDVDHRLQRRLQFVPVSPSGPTAADAARQGHKLARRVRAALGWGVGALGDVRALLESTLGIAVVVDALHSSNLRAASILDADRAAAAAVLAHDDRHRADNPLLARVHLAHEMCHLLFDPCAPGCVRVDLEDPSLGDRTTGRGTTGLLESRAKGFAAELLMPYGGLEGLLGPPAHVASLEGAKTIVDSVRNFFGTPWEIATWHLRNHGFVASEMVSGLRNAKVPPLETEHGTTLPTSGGGSLALSSRFELGEEIASSAPSYVDGARRAALAAAEALTDAVLASALTAVEEGRTIAAVDAVVDRVDDLLHAGDIVGLDALLRKLDPDLLPPEVSTAALMVAMHGPEALESAREALRVRLQRSLHERWELSPEVVESTMRRLR